MVLILVSMVHIWRERQVLTIVLGDLIPRRLILVEIVFPVKPTNRLYLTVQGNSGA
jgi:hypothetical protein